jgi:hypothetical protein
MIGFKEKVQSTEFIPGMIPDVAGSWVELMTTIPQLMPNLLPTYRPSEIVYGGKRYILREPLECVVRWDVSSISKCESKIDGVWRSQSVPTAEPIFKNVKINNL